MWKLWESNHQYKPGDSNIAELTFLLIEGVGFDSTSPRITLDLRHRYPASCQLLSLSSISTLLSGPRVIAFMHCVDIGSLNQDSL